MYGLIYSYCCHCSPNVIEEVWIISLTLVIACRMPGVKDVDQQKFVVALADFFKK